MTNKFEIYKLYNEKQQQCPNLSIMGYKSNFENQQIEKIKKKENQRNQ